MADCKDELDEKECRVVEFPTKQQYKKSLPPIQRKEDGSITKTEVVMVIVNHGYENTHITVVIGGGEYHGDYRHK